MQNSLGKKSALSTAKIFERKVILKAIKELQLLKLVYAILEETIQRVYWSSTYHHKGYSPLNRKWCYWTYFLFNDMCFWFLLEETEVPIIKILGKCIKA